MDGGYDAIAGVAGVVEYFRWGLDVEAVNLAETVEPVVYLERLA